MAGRLAARVKQRMAQLGLNQEDVIRKGVPSKTLWNLISGATKRPQMTTIGKLAEALEVTEEWLILGEDGSFPLAPQATTQAADGRSIDSPRPDGAVEVLRGFPPVLLPPPLDAGIQEKHRDALIQLEELQARAKAYLQFLIQQAKQIEDSLIEAIEDGAPIASHLEAKIDERWHQNPVSWKTVVQDKLGDEVIAGMKELVGKKLVRKLLLRQKVE